MVVDSDKAKFINDDCLNMLHYIDVNSIDICITSPLYNIGEYKSLYNGINDNVSIEDYLELLRSVFIKVAQVLKVGGRLCLNLNQMLLMPVIVELVKSCGLIHKSTIIWNKNTIPCRTAWGSWKSPSSPNVLPSFEYIIVFYKGQYKHVGKKENIDITKEEFIKYTNGLWEFAPGRQKLVTMRAAFPRELPYRLLKLYSYVGDVVLDPFAGSGTTLKVASDLGRSSIGFELNKDIFNEAVEKWEVV